MDLRTQSRSAAAAALALTLLCQGHAWAQGPSPLGEWKIIDDKTGQGRAVIRIEQVAGALVGRIRKSLDPNEPPDVRCTKCSGALKDQPLFNMAILTGLKPAADPLQWSDGEILDPDNGKVYRAKLTMAPDGKSLEVRGFVGMALFGRSQTWVRID